MTSATPPQHGQPMVSPWTMMISVPGLTDNKYKITYLLFAAQVTGAALAPGNRRYNPWVV